MDDQKSLALIAEASHVFVQQLESIDLPLINSTMAADVKVFPFPSLVLRNPWLFDSDNGYRDDVAQALPEGRIRHFDGALAKASSSATQLIFPELFSNFANKAGES